MPTEESSHDPFGLLEHVATSLGSHFYTYVFQPDGTFETIFEIGAAWETFLAGPTPADTDDDAAWVAAVNPDDRALYEALDEPIRRGEAVDAQYRLIGVDGRTRWVEVHERARSRGDGKIVVDGVVSDVIMAAVDTYCAITDDRLFRPSRPHADAITELERSAGMQLDPGVVAALVRALERERGRIAASLLRGVA